ncbi:MAG: hypothetical protein LBN02_07440 [Oscillospiraceae bacterium]|jgi:hypothetical protein|nr:hypothetical protein [Oscillospiraceae bacterium]
MSIRDKVRERAGKEDVVGHLIKATYHLFTHPYIQPVTALLATTGMSVLTNLITNDDPPPSAIAWFIVLAVVFVLAQTAFIFANTHSKRKISDNMWFQSALNGQATTNISIARDTADLLNDVIEHKTKGSRVAIDTAKRMAGLQIIGLKLCESIYNVIQQFEAPQTRVTIFQLFQGYKQDGTTYIFTKMMAYHNVENSRPRTFATEFRIEGAIKDTDPYHVKIFKSYNGAETEKYQHRTIYCLKGKSEIKEHFAPILSNSRECNIEQYIGVPVRNNNGEIVMLLQIDTSDKPNILGNTQKEMEELVQNILFPYTEILRVSFYRERLLEELM